MDLKQYRSKLIGNEDERAVSPVIGVILMVAITVILAAVIAAFVLDMGQSQSANAQAGVNVDESQDPHIVTITSMGDNTETVRCASTTSGTTSASSVGEDIKCDDGDNIVAVTESGEETVIQSGI